MSGSCRTPKARGHEHSWGRGRRGILACSFAVLSIGACRREPAAILAPCVEAVNLQVTRGETAPTFTWAPTCGANWLRVEGDNTGTVWEISGRDFGPPVVYGRVPPRVLTSGMVPLERGRTYVVQIAYGTFGAGTASFVW